VGSSGAVLSLPETNAAAYGHPVTSQQLNQKLIMPAGTIQVEQMSGGLTASQLGHSRVVLRSHPVTAKKLDQELTMNASAGAVQGSISGCHVQPF
jgi:hypothetical protein